MNANNPSSPRRPTAVGTPTHVSEPAFEFLLHAMIEQVEIECKKEYDRKVQQMKKSMENDGNDNGTEVNGETQEGKREGEDSGEEGKKDTEAPQQASQPQEQKQQQLEAEREEQNQKHEILMNENIAAKMERMGFDVGYRLVERLSQSKSLIPPTAHTKTPSQTLLQLEAVKFICKEFWTEVFRKQIDKLQTNHKGVFVLKDTKFKWLDRMPSDLDLARSMAIKILALPCGLIRGALSNLGIAAVVSCDFMDDGEHMDSCSFNVKIK